ncbi:hypothetical protein [Streptomyces sp. 7-21]|jgi:hypothetical protein|uniref:hypothetical protein n=1 Tax=Streptomyces sp. 7-21 TaxID=2802283 RepID=UPI00191F72C8|nr:hypothetical protein [Streptomyces sp. 7-21]MBL1067679.1 hypothetical protein [Streptomyces sp. 7-21]
MYSFDATDMAAVTRDQLREAFALLDITACVQLGTVAMRRSIVVSPLPVDDARRLVHALRGSQLDGLLSEKVRQKNAESATSAQLRQGR